MKRRIFLDGRKLGDGGIGTFIKSFVEGLIDSNNLSKTDYHLDIVVSQEFNKNIGIPSSWRELPFIKIHVDSTKKYSFQEYLFFPFKWKSIIDESDIYISPHYTLPFFISIKKLVVIHDLIQVQFPEKFVHKYLPKLLINSALSRADYIATVSQSSKKKLVEFSKLKKEISVIPNSVRLSLRTEGFEAKFKNVAKNALFFGSDRSHKQLDLFLDFVKIANERRIDINGIVISKLSKSSIKKIKELGIQNNLKIYDSISDSELIDIYSETDVLVNTSLDEGFCLPILEAQFLGISVICPDLDFANELVKENGYFYESESVSDLLKTWVKLNTDSESRMEKIRHGKIRAHTYLPLEQFKKFLSIVEN